MASAPELARAIRRELDSLKITLSWALRELSQRKPAEVRAFLREHRDRLAPRVRREVENKLSTGLKNPKR